MKKKINTNIIKTILIFIIILILMPISFADDENEIDELINIDINTNEIENNINQNEINVINQQNKEPILNSKRYAVYDRKSGLTIYGKDENKQTAMASTTKIMTAVIVLENSNDFNKIVKISAKAASTGGSRLGLNKNDEISIHDLLYGLMLRSGNDAAIALAEEISGNIEEFTNLMNEKAKKLGLKNTNFVTPHGLDNPKHYTTASELAKITNYALQNEKFLEIVKTQYKEIRINGKSKQIKNTNELLFSNVEGVYGVKTGFTNNAGRCLVTGIKKENMDLIIVVLGADTRKERAKDTLKLVDYITKEYRIENLNEIIEEEFENWKNINEDRIYVNKANNKIKTELKEEKIKEIVTNKQINLEINSLTNLDAPIEKNTKIRNNYCEKWRRYNRKHRYSN